MSKDNDQKPSQSEVRPQEVEKNDDLEEFIRESMSSAGILRSENLLEDAKKILRGILRRDAGYIPAKILLEEIHEDEVKHLFSEGYGRRRSKRDKESDDPSGIADALYQELRIDDHDQREKDRRAELEKAVLQQKTQSLQCRLDLGVACLSMGLSAAAVELFNSVLEEGRRDREGLRSLIVSASGLLANTHLDQGRAFQCIAAVEPILSDLEIPDSEKIPFFYYMGRSYEVLNRKSLATKWYQKVEQLDPFYRDLRDRLYRNE